MSDFGELSMDGRLALPGDADWDEARQAFNLVADQRPEAVALVESAGDIAAAVEFAAANELKVAAQSTGHGAPALAPLEGTILIKTERMRGTDVDAGGLTARIEPGVIARELAQAAGEHGLSFLPGAATTVGVVGYTLGGGLGWLGRRHGFACNSVRALDVVTVAGEPKTVDADNDADLFWALRGAGGGYAVVTRLHLELRAIGDLFAGQVIYPAEIGADAVRAWRDWLGDVPDEVTSMLRWLHPPDVPDVPKPIRDKHLLAFGAAFIGSEEEGKELTAPLRELGEPILDSFAQIPASGLGEIAMDPEDPVPGLGHHGLVAELPDQAVDAFVGVAGADSGSPLILVELRQLGGALGRAPENAGALDKLDAAFTLFGTGSAMTPELGEATTAHLDRIIETMRPWAAEGGIVNLADRPAELEQILPAETCSRLAEVKRRWDPDGRIVGNHNVALAPA